MILITGLMRSGTSLAARIAHQSGVDMGIYFYAPVPMTTFDLEYEDAPLTHFLSARPEKDDAKKFLQEYLPIKKESSRADAWGYKSPFALFYMDEIKQVLQDMGEPLHIIKTFREPEEIYRSLSVRSMEMGLDYSALHRLQNEMEMAYNHCKADIVLDHDFMRQDAEIASAYICDLAGIKQAPAMVARFGVRA